VLRGTQSPRVISSIPQIVRERFKQRERGFGIEVDPGQRGERRLGLRGVPTAGDDVDVKLLRGTVVTWSPVGAVS